ncbi:glycoside hydrolase family 13 protein [Shewanella waksmanii]|uniref:glycoside hydrolase family 13 protein n=1 Tax=Shewanella waksmanii TaxID=213783 RepID=UPI003736489E
MAMAHFFTIKQQFISFATQAKRVRITLASPYKLASLVLLSVASVAASANSQSIKVEPEFWWAGMQQPKLQLMLHGQDINQYAVSIQTDTDTDTGSNSGAVEITRIEKTDNPNYLFITLDISQAKPHTFNLMLGDNKGNVQTVPYQLKQRASSRPNGFSNQDTLYLITPDRFVNGDSNNDNQPSMLEKVDRLNPDGRHGGDIAGIIKSLDYLQALGVTQLWINPLTENNQPQYSYHGYSVTDHYRIDPRFGSNQDYQALSQAAQQRGIGIIKDVVVNHIGSEHWWMTDLPSKDWVNGQNQPISYTNHRRTTIQDPYATAEDRQLFTDGWFVETMPDLNQTNPLLATYLIQNSIWWIEFAQLSGIREDTYSYADKDFLNDWANAILTEYPNFNIVGEEWSGNPITVAYWQQGKVNHDGYQSALPSLMDFPLYETLIKALNEPEGWDTGLIKLYEFLGNDGVYADPTKLVLFEGNHDTNRLYSLFGEDLALTQMAMAYVLTSNRVPQIFYGSEILMQSPTDGRNDGKVRSDFPGGWPNDAISAFNRQGLNKQQLAMLDFMQTLLNYRKTSDIIHQGKMQHFIPKDGIYVQLRSPRQSTPNGKQLLVIYNKNDEVINLDLQRFAAYVDLSAAAKNIITGERYSLTKPMTLSQKGVTLIEISGE